MTIKLSGAQLVVLSAACQRPDRSVLPLPERMKGGAAQKIIASLIGKALIEELAAGPGEPVWREGEDGGRTTLQATAAAFQALGIEPGDGADRQGSVVDALPAGDNTKGAATMAEHAATPAEAATGGDGAEPASTSPTAGQVHKHRADTKQAQLVAMLQKPDGGSLDEIVAATGWQAHTVRGAIAGALKRNLGLNVTSEKVEGRGRVYRI